MTDAVVAPPAVNPNPATSSAALNGSTPPAVTTPPAGSDAPFYEAFEPDVKEFCTRKGFTDVTSLAKSAFNADRHISGAKDVIAIPKDDAAPEAHLKVFDQLGRPKEATGYDFKFGEKDKPDEKFVGFAKEMFHGAGLTQRQAEAVVGKWNGYAAEQQQARDDANATAVAALKQSWGAELETNITAAKAAVKGLGLDTAALDELDASLAGGAASVMKLMATIGKKIGKEDTTPANINNGGNGGANPLSMTPDEAKVSIQSLISDTAFQKKVQTKTEEGHADALARWNALHQAAYPPRR